MKNFAVKTVFDVHVDTSCFKPRRFLVKPIILKDNNSGSQDEAFVNNSSVIATYLSDLDWNVCCLLLRQTWGLS